MRTPEVESAQARYRVACRWHGPDSPMAAAARTELVVATTAERIEKQLSGVNLTPEQRRRLRRAIPD